MAAGALVVSSWLTVAGAATAANGADGTDGTTGREPPRQPARTMSGTIVGSTDAPAPTAPSPTITGIAAPPGAVDAADAADAADADEREAPAPRLMPQPAAPIATPPSSAVREPHPTTAVASEPAVLADASAPLSLWPGVRTWASDEHVQNPDVLLEQLDRFEPPGTPTNNLGRTGGPVWLHVALQVDADSDGQWLLALHHAPLDDARVYVYEDGRRIAQHSLGSFQAFADRPLPTRTHAAPLQLRAGTRVDLLLRVSARSTAIVPLTLEKPATLLRAESRAQLLHGLELGMLLALLVYGLAQAGSLRDHAAWASAALVAGSVGVVLFDSGLGQQYVWERQADEHVAKLGSVFLLLMAAGSAWFVRHVVATRKTLPIVDGMLRALAIVAVAGLATAPFSSVAEADLRQLAGIAGPLVLMVALPAAWRAWQRRAQGASLLLAGLVCQVAGAVVTTTIAKGWMPVNGVTLHLFEVANLMGLAAWTHVLATRARGARRKAATTQAERRQFERLARTDTLTGLRNRRGVSAALEQALEQRDAEATTLIAVYLIDLDRFKPVNDEHGHEVGDALLEQVGRRLATTVRASDVVGRLGADQFVVIADKLEGNADAHAMGHKLMSLFREPFVVGGVECRTGASIGYAVAPEHGESGAHLMRCADLAMDEAKQAGGGRLERHDLHTLPLEREPQPAFDVKVQRITNTDELRHELEATPSIV